MIDSERIIELLEEVIEETPTGGATVYHRDILDETTAIRCYYVRNDQPSCLVGRVLFKLGVPIEQLRVSDPPLVQGGAPAQMVIDNVFSRDDITWNARAMLCVAQNVQDGGGTWAQALEKARERDPLPESDGLPVVTKKITAQQAYDALKAVVAAKPKGDQFIYNANSGARDNCLYLGGNSRPSCIVGRALFSLGVPTKRLRQMDKMHTPEGVYDPAIWDATISELHRNGAVPEITDAAAAVFAAAQGEQDCGNTWGDALKAARKRLKGN